MRSYLCLHINGYFDRVKTIYGRTFTTRVFAVAERVYDVQRQNILQSLLTVDGDLVLLNSSDGITYSPINDLLPVPIQEVELRRYNLMLWVVIPME